MKKLILTTRPYRKIILSSLMAIGLVACSDNAQLPSAQTYEVTVTNLTSAQPFSPPNIVFHSSDYSLWKQGEAASVALEKVAEGGDGSDLDTLDGVTQVYTASSALTPGAKESFTITVNNSNVDHVSVVTMLVNTNDAFTGKQNIDIASMNVGDMRSYRIFAYDAGTEANTEASGTMPGPADGGVGFVAERTGDVDFVHVHSGVISQDDGLTSSVLTAAHRFDTPVVAIKISRTF